MSNIETSRNRDDKPEKFVSHLPKERLKTNQTVTKNRYFSSDKLLFQRAKKDTISSELNLSTTIKEKEETKNYDTRRRVPSRERSQDTRESDTEKQAKAKNRYDRRDRYVERSQEKERSDRLIDHEPRIDHNTVVNQAERRVEDENRFDRPVRFVFHRQESIERRWKPQDRYVENRNEYERPGRFTFYREQKRYAERDVDYGRNPRFDESEDRHRKTYEYPKDFRQQRYRPGFPRYENYQDIDRSGRYVDSERRAPKYIPGRYDEYDSEPRRPRNRRSRSNSRDRDETKFISPVRRRSISSREISRSPPRSRSFNKIPEEDMGRVRNPVEESLENKVLRKKRTDYKS